MDILFDMESNVSSWSFSWIPVAKIWCVRSMEQSLNQQSFMGGTSAGSAVLLPMGLPGFQQAGMLHSAIGVETFPVGEKKSILS